MSSGPASAGRCRRGNSKHADCGFRVVAVGEELQDVVARVRSPVLWRHLDRRSRSRHEGQHRGHAERWVHKHRHSNALRIRHPADRPERSFGCDDSRMSCRVLGRSTQAPSLALSRRAERAPRLVEHWLTTPRRSLVSVMIGTWAWTTRASACMAPDGTGRRAGAACGAAQANAARRRLNASASCLAQDQVRSRRREVTRPLLVSRAAMCKTR